MKPSDCSLFVDAGVRNLRLRACSNDGSVLFDSVIPSNSDLHEVSFAYQIKESFGSGEDARIFVTGKLAETVRETLGCGKVVLPAALFWLAARDLIGLPENAGVASLAMLDLSASGFMVVGIDRAGMLKDDLLLLNPRCGAGSGINLDRVLQKLAVTREEVDPLLRDYLGETGRQRREKVPVRTDRCGVFASSATISDKNQGIPLDVALATTLKSEILKACTKLPEGCQKIYLTGRIFRWQYARDCAEDFLQARGVGEIAYDTENTQALDSLRGLVERVGVGNLLQPDPRLLSRSEPEEYPSFVELKSRYEASGHYLRLPDDRPHPCTPEALAHQPVVLGLDVGSTMAKAVLADAESGDTLFAAAYSNAGDTIETIKQVFKELRRAGVEQLPIRSVGITGSARYQVQQTLSQIYPSLAQRTLVLVENYAHARGSIDHARRHVRRLKAQGFTDVSEEFCILIDVGGEDTKISTIALKQAELFDNAMNLKCSAGTGSLMDSLSAMFEIESVAEACARAYLAPRSFAITATCAVFLMEDASKLQAQGVPMSQILASASWAIVENMARTLWNQLELPGNAVVLLHGQTMLSEPLPLAVTHSLQSYLGRPAYVLVPPQPGHRACIGLIRNLLQASLPGFEKIRLADLIDSRFNKHIIQCKGAACGDPSARCNRSSLSCRGADGAKISFTLGGCTAVNELLDRKVKEEDKGNNLPRDTYKEIWEFIDGHHPTSKDPGRLVIPRSFAVSEWAYFLARIFHRLGIPVHVDNVRDSDLIDAQPYFNIESCGPQMGAVGQFRRLAGEPHGVILAPQLETLPTNGKSRGLTCTTNQGGVAVAKNLAEMAHPAARFHLIHLDLERLESGFLCDQLHGRLQALFRLYGVAPTPLALQEIIGQALGDHQKLRGEAADLTAGLMEEALANGCRVALAVGHEYVLNPGIYDSHIRRLLRDKQMAVIPSYVLEIELDEDFGHVYWRNPHLILSLLNAVAHRSLHRRLRHPRLRDIFRRIETDPADGVLPVAQVSTFSCGPDSIIAHYVAEIMKRRPFLTIQSDAIIKELAHLENRVNTYVKQLQQGLHGKLQIGGEGPFEVRTLNRLLSHEPPNRETDVIYFPTLSDNRPLSAVLRGAGYTCIENYDDETYDLEELVKAGRKATGDAVCAPLAAMYADLIRGVDDFVQRKRADDPLTTGKKRLLFFDSQGGGPCRQGQFPAVHRLLFQRSANGNGDDPACNALPGGAIFQLLVGSDAEGYDTGFEEWVMLRAFQGVILQGVLHGLLFKGGAACSNYQEYQRFLADYRRLKTEIYRLLESYQGPGPIGRSVLKLLGDGNRVSIPIKYLLYRLHGHEFARLLKRFVSSWEIPEELPDDPLRVWITGESYMRVSQAEVIFQTLLSNLGFRRFNLGVTPLMSFLEYLLDEAELKSLSAIEVAKAEQRRSNGSHEDADALGDETSRLRKIKLLRFVLRHLLAGPLYRAAKLQMPPASADLVKTSKGLIPTLRPLGELAPYVGEAITELRHGVDLFLNVGPNGCMVSSMGEMLTPRIMHTAGAKSGRIQYLFSAEGELNRELLTLAMLKAIGPERYYGATPL